MGYANLQEFLDEERPLLDFNGYLDKSNAWVHVVLFSSIIGFLVCSCIVKLVGANAATPALLGGCLCIIFLLVNTPLELFVYVIDKALALGVQRKKSSKEPPRVKIYACTMGAVVASWGCLFLERESSVLFVLHIFCTFVASVYTLLVTVLDKASMKFRVYEETRNSDTFARMAGLVIATDAITLCSMVSNKRRTDKEVFTKAMSMKNDLSLFIPANRWTSDASLRQACYQYLRPPIRTYFETLVNGREEE